MKKYLLCYLLLMSFLSVNAQIDTASYRALSRKIQLEMAPDKRDIYVNFYWKGDSAVMESTDKQVLDEFLRSAPKNVAVPLLTKFLPAAGDRYNFGVVTISVANNRANPQHGAELMTQMLMGTPIQVLKKQGGFYLIRTPDQYLAWTDGSAFQLMDEQAFRNWKQAKKLIVVADYGHAYAAASANSTRVSDLVSGNILKFIAEEGSFFKVEFPDGRMGYVAKNLMTNYDTWLKHPIPSNYEILEKAFTLIGVPYLWGGTSVKGVDCSGFTKTAYFLNGIIIPRDASQQAKVGEAIDVLEGDTISIKKCLANLKPGDLLFFSAAKRRGINGGKITHTAIYVGKGEFIQSAGMVKVSSLLAEAENYDEAQTRTLVGARRILTVLGSEQITPVSKHPWYGLAK